MTVRSARWGLVALGLVTYGIYYIGRVNLAVAAPLLGTERGLTAGEVGLLAAAFFWVYALGGVAVGLLADRYGSRLLVACGLLGSAAANLVFGLSDAWIAMLVAWTLNGMFQAMGWSPLVGGLTRWVPEERAESAAMFLGASFVVGSTLGLGVGSALVGWSGVEGAFVVPSVVMAVFGLVWWWSDSNDNARATRQAPPPLREVARSIVRTARLWPVVGLVGLVYVAMLIWLPLYLAEVHGLSPGRAGFLSALLIGFGVLGPVAASRWLDSAPARHRHHAVILAGASGCLVLVLLADRSVWVAGVLLAAGSVLVAGSASVVLGGFAFSGDKTGVATLSGVLALIFNLGGGIGSVVIGRMVDQSAWHGVFALLAAAMAGSAVLELKPGLIGSVSRS